MGKWYEKGKKGPIFFSAKKMNQKSGWKVQNGKIFKIGSDKSKIQPVTIIGQDKIKLWNKEFRSKPW